MMRVPAIDRQKNLRKADLRGIKKELRGFRD